jgi:hypothetical protein
VVPIAPLGGNPFLAGDLSPEERGRRTAAARMACERLTQFEIPAGGDRATRDLIELCRREGIGLVLLLTPEGEAYRSWYPPYARPLLDGYCATLLRETGVTVIDARDWLAEEDFVDSHHADRRGAVAFSRRLGTDVLGPLIQGRIPTPR